MANNPLQKYFRQPKIFISLPSQGIYNKQGAITGDVTRLPVYGMTGMDEIMLKTADALISGESTARVIQSCIPDIADPWNVSSLDIDLILTSIRVATYGNELEANRICSECDAENTYTFNLSSFIDFYSSCEYNNSVTIGNITVVIRPLSYKQSTDFALENFAIQQTIVQINNIEDATEQKKATNDILEKLTLLRHRVFAAGIESVSVEGQTVTNPEHIREWLLNVDRDITEQITQHIEANKKAWTPPMNKTVCDSCGHEEFLPFELDQSNFFGNA